MKLNNEKEKESDNDKLKLKEKGTNMLLAAFMIFIFPIITIFVCAYLGNYIGKSLEANSVIPEIIGGTIGLLASAIIIKKFDKCSKAGENVEKIHWDDL